MTDHHKAFGEIIEDLQSALEELQAIADDLGRAVTAANRPKDPG